MRWPLSQHNSGFRSFSLLVINSLGRIPLLLAVLSTDTPYLFFFFWLKSKFWIASSASRRRFNHIVESSLLVTMDSSKDQASVKNKSRFQTTYLSFILSVFKTLFVINYYCLVSFIGQQVFTPSYFFLIRLYHAAYIPLAD